jgi:hypothetical protein
LHGAGRVWGVVCQEGPSPDMPIHSLPPFPPSLPSHSLEMRPSCCLATNFPWRKEMEIAQEVPPSVKIKVLVCVCVCVCVCLSVCSTLEVRNPEPELLTAKPSPTPPHPQPPKDKAAWKASVNVTFGHIIRSSISRTKERPVLWASIWVRPSPECWFWRT